MGPSRSRKAEPGDAARDDRLVTFSGWLHEHQTAFFVYANSTPPAAAPHRSFIAAGLFERASDLTVSWAPGLLISAMAVVPFVDRSTHRSPGRRRAFIIAGAIVLIALVALVAYALVEPAKSHVQM